MIVRDHLGSRAAALCFQVPPHQRLSSSLGISGLCTPSSIAHRTLPFKYKQCDPHTPASWPKHVWEDRETSAGANRGRWITLRNIPGVDKEIQAENYSSVRNHQIQKKVAMCSALRHVWGYFIASTQVLHLKFYLSKCQWIIMGSELYLHFSSNHSKHYNDVMVKMRLVFNNKCSAQKHIFPLAM